MKVSISNGTLTISMPLDENGVPSASGKSLTHASTRGNVRTSETINGQPLTVSLNAYTSNPAAPKDKPKGK